MVASLKATSSERIRTGSLNGIFQRGWERSWFHQPKLTTYALHRAKVSLQRRAIRCKKMKMKSLRIHRIFRVVEGGSGEVKIGIENENAEKQTILCRKGPFAKPKELIHCCQWSGDSAVM